MGKGSGWRCAKCGKRTGLGVRHECVVRPPRPLLKGCCIRSVEEALLAVAVEIRARTEKAKPVVEGAGCETADIELEDLAAWVEEKAREGRRAEEEATRPWWYGTL